MIKVTTTRKTRITNAEEHDEALAEAARAAIMQAGGNAVTLESYTEYIAPDKYEGDITYEYDWEFQTRTPATLVDAFTPKQ